jgi:HD-like signal output (HDOD) protein
MTMQLENSLQEAEEHLLRAEAEMAKAVLNIVEAAKTCSDQRLSQLADVLSAHTLLVAHLATITGSAFYPNLPLEPGIPLPGRQATQLF